MAFKSDPIFQSVNSQRPILAFPVRVETHFDDKHHLLIRIIPDEILIKSETASLTETELGDGKRFWIEWFIASGNKRREYAAWESLCARYQLDDAVRICNLARPVNLDLYRIGGEKFSLRPYAFLNASGQPIDVMETCTDIYVQLGKISEINPDTAVKNFDETLLTQILLQITVDLDSIAYVFEYSHDIVDYIYDSVSGCVSYLSDRLDSITRFYERHPKFKDNPTAFDFEDRDYLALLKLKERVARLLKDAEGRVISLDKMTTLYLEKFDKEFFGIKATNPFEHGSVPEASLLPNYFVACAKTFPNPNGGFDYIYGEGREVKEHLPMGLDMSSGSSSAYSVDAEGNLTIEGGLKWLVDFEAAKEVGLGIVLDVPQDCDGFEAVYVFGIRKPDVNDDYHLEHLFKSHRYYDGGISLLKTGTPTNLVEGCREEKVLDDKELMRLRYELEIEDAGNQAPKESDGRVLADVLGISYAEGINRWFNLDNTELSDVAKAQSYLWGQLGTHFLSERKPMPIYKGYLMNHVIRFMLNYVNPRGIAPMFRIGDKPYGIVAATDLDIVHFPIDSQESLYDRMLLDAVIEAARRWGQMLDKVPSPETMKGQDAERMFIDMVAQTPRSVSYKEQVYLDSPFTEGEPAPKASLFKHLEKAGLFTGRPIAGDLTSPQFYALKEYLRGLKEELPYLEDWQVERLMSDFFDQFTFRVDVWYTAFVRYLRSINTNPEAKRTPAVGCYGWVFNLKRNTQKDKQKGEYIIAPSLQHALTAAVLRNAYLSSQASAEDSHMCINLSSMRVRQALRMLDGIKLGMSTGVILGADMERYLHEARKADQFGIEMDELIYPLRKLFPQTVNLEAQDSLAEDYQMSVINGEALLNCFVDKWQHQKSVSDWLSDIKNFQSIPQFDYLYKEAKLDVDKVKALSRIIERVQDSYDALNDLLLAEGVHRLIAGDKASFAAISSFMKDGSGNLPEPAVLDSPSEYVVVTHKAAMAVPQATPADNAGILTLADPCVAEWLRGIIGNPGNYFFALVFKLANGFRKQYSLSLADVGIEIPEYFYLSSNLNVLKNAIEFRWRQATGNFGGTVRILTGDPAELETGDTLPTSYSFAMTIYEASMLVDDVRGLLSYGRALRPGDMIPNIESDELEERAMDVDEIRKRYESILDRVADAADEMEALANRAQAEGRMEDEVLLGLYGLLDTCASAGMLNLSHAFDSSMLLCNFDPVANYLDYTQAIEKQGKFLVDILGCIGTVRDKVAEARRIVGEDQEYVPVSRYVEAIQVLTMKGVKVFPKFRIDAVADELETYRITEQNRGYTYFTNLREGFDMDAWLSDIAEVRSGMNRLYNYRQLSYFRYGNSGGRISILQPETEQAAALSKEHSPHDKGPEWLGAPVSSEYALDDADSLMLFESENTGKDGWFCGFVFDSWIEYIPYRKKTAGMVFRCDQPDAEAPQALLLAVSPESNTKKAKENWTRSGFLNLLMSAAKMAKIRTVSPDVVSEHEASGPLGSFLTSRPINENAVNIVGPSKGYSATNLKAAVQKAKEEGIVPLDENGAIPKDLYAALLNTILD